MLFKKNKEIKQEGFITEIKIDESGQKEVYTDVWKYPLKGTPRKHFFDEILDPLNHQVNNIILDVGWKLINSGAPEKEYIEPVREIARLFDLLTEAEEADTLKQKWQRYKRAVCTFLQEDDAYRLRFLWALSKADLNKLKMKKEDLWWLSKKGFNINAKLK